MKTALVLEGGALRTIYSSGVCDAFLDGGLPLQDYTLGVSAGIAYGVSYLSRQSRRNLQLVCHYANDKRYMGFRNLADPRNRSYFGLKFAYETIPNELLPFDYDTFFSSKQTCILTATNCFTGRPAYLTENCGNRIRLMNACRASSSLPIVSPMVEVDGIPMLDGGVADSVPIRKALHDGVKKNVVILTRQAGYRKPPARKSYRMAKIMYQKYPYLVRAIKNRAYYYNRTMELLDDLEKRGRILVLRPQVPVVRNTEDDVAVLTAFYNHGYEYAKDMFSRTIRYLGWEPGERSAN